MNWCKPHWTQLRAAIKDKGLDGFGAQDGEESTQALANALEGEEGPFDPLIGCWLRINAYMFESPACNGRILQCPLCILVDDKQPELVEKWIDGCTQSALDYALEQGLIKKQ